MPGRKLIPYRSHAKPVGSGWQTFPCEHPPGHTLGIKTTGTASRYREATNRCLYRITGKRFRRFLFGGVAQLGERSVRIREVKGSNPSVSTTICPKTRFDSGFSDKFLYFFYAKQKREGIPLSHGRNQGPGAHHVHRSRQIVGKETQPQLRCGFLLLGGLSHICTPSMIQWAVYLLIFLEKR